MSVISLLCVSQVNAQDVIENQTSELEKITNADTIITPVQSVEVKTDELENSIEEMITIATPSTATSSVEVYVENTILDSESQFVADTVHVFIRNGEQVVLNAETNLSGDITKIIDTTGVEHSISSKSVLAILKQIDLENDSFEISDIQYYESFNSLYLKCITIESLKVCDNWQFVVNGSSPFTSIDTTILESGDSLGLYFGSPYQIIFDNVQHMINAPIGVTAQVYDYQTNIWNPRTGVTVGVTVSNPIDAWNPLELFTQSVDSAGKASFIVATSGQYMIGIKDDWYYPLYSISVSSSTGATTTATSTGTETKGGSGTQKKVFDISGALSFLKSLQGANGSFGGSELYTDWVAIAFGAADEKNTSLITYLKSKAKVKDILTDNERRAMALLALGENPYDFAGINYIDAIEKAFDGIQFGEKQLVNDDIFALIVLSKVGYSSKDEIIKKTISFIIEKQNTNGSWEGSPDLTSATIQALEQFKSVSQVENSISSAKKYLIDLQNEDGGWGSVYSTSWALQSMISVDEQWKVGENTPQDYLISKQQEDGGVLTMDESEQNRIWATSYAIPAVLQKPWNQILESVSKPKLKITNATSTSSASDNTVIVLAEDEIDIMEVIQEEDIFVDTPVLNSDVIFKKDTVSESPTSEVSVNKEVNPTEISAKPQNINQLATVSYASLPKSLWLYLSGLLILGGVVVGIKYWKL